MLFKVYSEGKAEGLNELKLGGSRFKRWHILIAHVFLSAPVSASMNLPHAVVRDIGVMILHETSGISYWTTNQTGKANLVHTPAEAAVRIFPPDSWAPK